MTQTAPPKKRILALDPANACGFAHTNGRFGTWVLAGRHVVHPGRRLVKLAGRIRAACKMWGVDMIVYESQALGFKNPLAQASLSEVRAIIKMVAAEFDIEAVPVNPMTLKKYATGNGRAEKRDVVAACRRLLGVDVEDHNQADALMLLSLASQRDFREIVATKVKGKGGRGQRHSQKPGAAREAERLFPF